MATMQNHSIIRDTLENILATTPAYVGQQAYCTDYGIGKGLCLECLTAGVWGLPSYFQLIGAQNTDVSVPADTTEDTLYTLPGTGGLPSTIWRPNDTIRIATKWTQSTASTDTRRVRIKVQGTNVINTDIASATKAGLTHQYDIEFRNSLTAQLGGNSGVDVFGQTTNGPQTHTLNFASAAAVLITGQKTTAGETLTLNSVKVLLLGGG